MELMVTIVMELYGDYSNGTNGDYGNGTNGDYSNGTNGDYGNGTSNGTIVMVYTSHKNKWNYQ